MESIEFICLGSGSSGNAYIFKKGQECVLVECGFDYPKIVSKMINANIDPESIKAVIITHKHSDHSKSLEQFILKGVKVYAPASAIKEQYTSWDNVNIVSESNNKFVMTKWLKVLCFPVIHDVEAYGYAFLDTETKESTLFITDTKYFEFPLKQVMFDYIFIETNHIRKQLEAILQKRLDDGNEHDVFKFKRQASYHLGLYSTKKLLNDMNLKRTKAIFLIHLSKECCNDTIIREEIKSVYKIPTFVCYAEGRIN